MNPDILKLFYDYTLLDVVITTLLMLVSIYLTIKIRYNLQLNRNITLAIFAIHNLMFPIYLVYLFKYGSDSISYFIGFHGYIFLDFEPGQVFLNKILIFLDFFKMNFYNINYLFSIISLVSFYLLLKKIQDLKINNKSIFYLLVSFLFLPSIHFWHMGFSKDTLTFFSISLVLYEILKIKPNLIVIMFAMILLYFVRIHICLFVFLSLVLFYLFKINSFFLKIISIIFAIFLSQIMLKNIFNFTNIESIFQFLNIFRDLYIDNPVTALSSDTHMILKMLYYLFTPNILFLKDASLFYLIVALENTMLIFLFINIFSFTSFFSIKKIQYFSFLIVFSLVSLMILSYVTTNIGIAIRQKWIFLPSLVILLAGLKYKKIYK